MGGLRIRRYETGDREAVWRLHNEALDEVGAHLGNGARDDDLHEIEGPYLGAGGEFWSAFSTAGWSRWVP